MCNALDYDNNPYVDTEVIQFGVDDTPPIVAFTGPAPGTVFSPFSTFTVSGSVQDFSPLTHLGAISSYYGLPIASRINGNNFEFDFNLSASTSNYYPTYSTFSLTVNIGARDSVGLGSYESYDNGVSSIAVTIDAAPPAVAVLAPLGSVSTFSAVSGTASDSSGVAEVKLIIKDETTGKYWKGPGFVSTFPVVFSANVGAGGSWSYPGINDELVLAGHQISFAVAARDTFGNESSYVSFYASVPLPLQETGLTIRSQDDKLICAENYEVQYNGNWSANYCCQLLPGKTLSSSPRLTAVSRQGSVTAVAGTQAGCAVVVSVKADLNLCIENDIVEIFDWSSRIGVVPGRVLIPLSEEAKYLATESFRRADGSWSKKDLYQIEFKGKPGMDLFGQRGYETVSASHFIKMDGVRYWPCTIGVSQTGHDDFTGHSNILHDRWGLPTFFDGVGSGPRGIVCAMGMKQQIHINACTLPSPLISITGHIYVVEPNKLYTDRIDDISPSSH